MQINLNKEYELRSHLVNFEHYIIQCRCIDDGGEWTAFGNSHHLDQGLADLFIHIIANKMPNIRHYEVEVQHG